MYKVNEEALLQELEQLETHADQLRVTHEGDAKELGIRRGYSAERTAKIAELLLSTDEDYRELTDKLSYLKRFTEEVGEAAEKPYEAAMEAGYGEAGY